VLAAPVVQVALAPVVLEQMAILVAHLDSARSTLLVGEPEWVVALEPLQLRLVMDTPQDSS
jgi:hypothetical protein